MQTWNLHRKRRQMMSKNNSRNLVWGSRVEAYPLLMRCTLAFKYHPDRNPGHEVEHIPKFQAISAANEILSDPSLRAKFDAQRMRDGLLNSYSDAPPRPNVPPRPRPSSFTPHNFPPPPRPPPPSASKPSFSPPSSGARKYERFNRAKAGWAHSDTEDAKTKTNDFKAWEQMRHGQGPIPPKRAPPSKSTRTNTFEPRRSSPPGRTPHVSASKPRGAWEDLRDAGMPNLARSNTTTRLPPRKAGFVPSSPPVDEPPRSAYFNVFNGERPKTSSDMPPPPPRAPTSKRPDPPRMPARDPQDPIPPRFSTPYQTQPGEKTFHPNPGLQRSNTNAVPKEVNGRTSWYKDTLDPNGDHVRASSAGASDRDAAFKPAGFSSSTTSESSSDDEAETAKPDPIPRGYGQREQRIPTSRKSRMPAGGGPGHRTGFSPHVRVGNGKIPDEGQAPHPLYTGPRRHSGIDMSTEQPVSDQPEGFMAHRMKHDANLNGPQSESVPTASNSGERFMARHKSFDDQYRPPSKEQRPGSVANEDSDRTPMSGKSGYSPLSSLLYSGPLPSRKWSKEWPFGPLKSNASRNHEPAPFWIPQSNLPSIAETTVQTGICDEVPTLIKPYAYIGSLANSHFASFRLSSADDKSFTPTPLRSHSSDSININFSPSGTTPRFGGESPFFGRSASRQGKSSTFPFQAQEASKINGQTDQETADSPSTIPPPPKMGDKWSAEDWEKRFGTHTFELPANGPGSRASSRKRSGTPKMGSSNSLKRSGTFRPNNFQPTVVDADHEPSAYSTNAPESLGSSTTSTRVSTSSEGSAMDIDSTPPSANDQKPSLSTTTSPLSNPIDRPLTPRGPSLPPRVETPRQSETAPSLKLNLNDFRHVAPFAPSNEGLDNIDDLRSTLPFESRPSLAKPNFDHCSKSLELPRVPKSPRAPKDLTQSSWDRYIADMNAYMYNWNTFNIDIILMFHKRAEEHRKIGQSWVGQVGGDCEAYLQALVEDEKARKYWEVACDHHKECMTTLKDLRERALKAQNGG